MNRPMPNSALRCPDQAVEGGSTFTTTRIRAGKKYFYLPRARCVEHVRPHRSRASSTIPIPRISRHSGQPASTLTPALEGADYRMERQAHTEGWLDTVEFAQARRATGALPHAEVIGLRGFLVVCARRTSKQTGRV